VLAGLAAAARAWTRLPLGFAVTLAASAVGTLVAVWLLWQASLALGRAGPCKKGVAGGERGVPTLCFALATTAARWLGEETRAVSC